MDKGNKKKEVIVPIICLLLSTVLWFYVTNIENPIKTIEINKVPVNLVNVESLKNNKLALVPNQNVFVDLKVEGLGNQIYKLSKSEFNVQIDLSDYALKKGENKIPVAIVSSPSGVSIKNDNSLTVNVVLEEMSEKNIAVKSQVKVSVQKGFFASVPEINPKEITVSGPKSIVDSINNVVVVGEESNLSEDISGQYPLNAINSDGKKVEGVILSQDTAQVNIKVSKGKSVPLKVKTIGNLPNGVKLKAMELSRNTVEFIGPKEVLNNISEAYTTELNLSAIKDSNKVSLKVVVPDGVSVFPGEEYVDADVSVDKVVTKEFEVPITIEGQKDDIIITPKNKVVKVVLSGYQEIIDTVKIENIKAVLNVSSYAEDGTFEIAPKVTLNGVDSTVTISSAEKVSFTVKKKPIDKPVDGTVTE